MIFITLARWRKKKTKELIAETSKLMKLAEKEGAKFLGHYWTLGRYDGVMIWEGKDEKSALKALLRFGDLLLTENLVAVPREEAIKLLE